MSRISWREETSKLRVEHLCIGLLVKQSRREQFCGLPVDALKFRLAIATYSDLLPNVSTRPVWQVAHWKYFFLHSMISFPNPLQSSPRKTSFSRRERMSPSAAKQRVACSLEWTGQSRVVICRPVGPWSSLTELWSWQTFNWRTPGNMCAMPWLGSSNLQSEKCSWLCTVIRWFPRTRSLTHLLTGASVSPLYRIEIRSFVMIRLGWNWEYRLARDLCRGSPTRERTFVEHLCIGVLVPIVAKC